MEEVQNRKTLIDNMLNPKDGSGNDDVAENSKSFLGGKRKSKKNKKSRKFRTTRSKKRGGGNCIGRLTCRDIDNELIDNELIEYFSQRDGITGDVGKVRDLLKKGANSNGVDVYGMPILNKAILYGYTEITELLLEYDADPNYGDRDNNMAINMGIYLGRINLVKMLLNKGTTHLDNINNNGQTPLDFAEERLRFWKEQLPEENPTYYDVRQIEIATEIVNMLKQYMISPTIKKHKKNQQSRMNVHMVANPNKNKHKIPINKIPIEMEETIYDYLPKAGGGKSKRRRTRRNKKGSRRK